MTDKEKINNIKELLEFNDLCDCDSDAKDRGEMCNFPWECFKLHDKLKAIVYDLV
jgi:hypothetical protein